MGLSISHNAFDGAYSSFYAFREAIKGFPFEMVFKKPAIVLFLRHSDCDGEIEWEVAGQLAEDLQLILDKALADYHPDHFCDRLEQFIQGCKSAFEAKENLEFA